MTRLFVTGQYAPASTRAPESIRQFASQNLGSSPQPTETTWLNMPQEIPSTSQVCVTTLRHRTQSTAMNNPSSPQKAGGTPAKNIPILHIFRPEYLVILQSNVWFFSTPRRSSECTPGEAGS